jgi:hypothetical protein
MSQIIRPKGQSIKSPYSTKLMVLISIYHPVNNNAKYNDMFIQRTKHASKLYVNTRSNKLNKIKNLYVTPILYNKYNYIQTEKQNKEKQKNIKTINNQKCKNKENNTPILRDDSTNYNTRKPPYIIYYKHNCLKKKTTGNVKLKVQHQSFNVIVHHSFYTHRNKPRYHMLEKDSGDVYNAQSHTSSIQVGPHKRFNTLKDDITNEPSHPPIPPPKNSHTRDQQTIQYPRHTQETNQSPHDPIEFHKYTSRNRAQYPRSQKPAHTDIHPVRYNKCGRYPYVEII